MNLYVDDQVEDSTFLATQEIVSTTSPATPQPIQDTSRSAAFELHKPVVFMNSDNARIQWSVDAPDDKLSYLREFVVEFRQRDPMRDNTSSLWTQSDRIPPHVKAVTLRRLNPTHQYQFRVSGLFSNGYAEIYSLPTEWISYIDPQATVPLIPRITRLQTISHSSILLAWDHTTGSKFNAPEAFIISCLNTENDEPREIKIGNNSRELLITELDAGAEYEVTVIAENAAGRSMPSKPRIARTYGNIIGLFCV